MNLCMVCGAEIRNPNPWVKVCGRPMCSEIRATGLGPDELVREDSKIGDLGPCCFTMEVARYEGRIL